MTIVNYSAKRTRTDVNKLTMSHRDGPHKSAASLECNSFCSGSLFYSEQSRGSKVIHRLVVRTNLNEDQWSWYLQIDNLEAGVVRARIHRARFSPALFASHNYKLQLRTYWTLGKQPYGYATSVIIYGAFSHRLIHCCSAIHNYLADSFEMRVIINAYYYLLSIH